MDWIVNPEWNDQQPVNVGDIIHLKSRDAFKYLVKGIVMDVEPSRITARIESIFDWPSHAEIKISTIKQVVGEVVSVTPEYIHNVIKKIE